MLGFDNEMRPTLQVSIANELQRLLQPLSNRIKTSVKRYRSDTGINTIRYDTFKSQTQNSKSGLYVESMVLQRSHWWL